MYLKTCEGRACHVCKPVLSAASRMQIRSCVLLHILKLCLWGLRQRQNGTVPLTALSVVSITALANGRE